MIRTGLAGLLRFPRHPPQALPAQAITAVDRHRQPHRFLSAPAWSGQVAGKFRAAAGAGDAARDCERNVLTIRHDYLVIPSISAVSSALKLHPIALTFASICSTRVAPAMTLATCGREASHEKASSSML